MVRLARLVDNGRMPQFFVASDPEQLAFVATVNLLGLSAKRLATSRERAIYEAIGAILSASQRGSAVPQELPADVTLVRGSSYFVASNALDFSKFGLAVGRVHY